MRRATCGGLLVMVGWGLWFGASPVEASDPDISITLMPVRQAFVDGDVEKFRAHHWMKEDYAGGVKDAKFQHTFANGAELDMGGHALVDQNDLGSDISLKKEGLGFLKFDYTEFRKYYDGSAGVYRRFTTLQAPTTDKELALNIAKFGVEAGLTLERWPLLTFRYERERKHGAKSRLAWTSVIEEGLTRKIGPTWMDIDEVVDSFAINASHEIAGFTLKGTQEWEFVRGENQRESVQLSTNSTASERKIQRQNQDPQAILTSSTMEAERSFWDDKLYASNGFRYAHIKNREFERFADLNASGAPANFSTNAEQKVDAYANNKYATYTWVENVMYSPWQWLGLGANFKTEVAHRRSNSSYPSDDSPNNANGNVGPDGVIDHTEQSIADNKATRWGERFSVHMTRIPRTALYTELELEQARVLMREDRKSIDGPSAGNGSKSGEVWSRETVTHIQRSAWKAGGRVTPCRFFDVTTDVRHRVNNNDYDDQRETTLTNDTTARSAFFDGQSVRTNEFSARLTLKPWRWLRPAIRYQFRGDKWATRAENEPIVKTSALSHIYTYDLVVQPLDALTTTISYSRQQAYVTTPARLSSSVEIPTFNANVSTWLFSTEYSPTAHITLTNTILYSKAHNFNDFAATGMPFGADFHRTDLTTGVQWSPREDTTLGVDYALYRYNPNENVEAGAYTAHVIWLEVTQHF